MKANQVTEAIEAERAQIAAEVHDALLPLIFAASATLQQHLDREPPPEPTDPSYQRLAQASQWLQQALQMGRRIINQAGPPELVAHDWVAAAKTTLVDLHGDQAGHVHWDAPTIAFPESIALACYRIVVEAVRNALQHAKASSIRVTAAATDQRVTITVTDDGQGFDSDEVPSERFGLKAMQARAESIGGALAIESTEQDGTSIQLSFPLPR